ncbi:MAG: DUF2796 domain-containing protein [Paracoccaceae bacterium]
MKRTLAISTILLAGPLLAEDTRQLDAHEHGVGELNIAIDGTTLAMELHAPGADIVGFEYKAKSEEDRKAIDSGVATLARPLELFVFPAAAECNVTQASAALESEDDHHDHDHGHDHEHHDEHAEHEEHAEETTHSEFHAEYNLNCSDPSAISEITFAYFEAFPNARELEIQIASASGAQSFEVTREQPTLDLRGMF